MSAVAAGASLGVNAALLIRARSAVGLSAAAARYSRVGLVAARAAPWGVRPARWNSSFAPRVGKAVEPSAEWDGKAEQKKEGETSQEVKKEDDKKQPAPVETKPKTNTNTNTNTPQTRSVVKLEENQDQPSPKEESQKHGLDPRSRNKDTEKDSTGGEATDDGSATLDHVTRQIREDAKQSGPLEAVLGMEPPRKVARQHPSMSPPPYVHHFDSYSLVKQLQDGGYSPDQAIEAMKGIRALLAQNLDVAQESLVSKSDVENETYLFRAACSELGQEIKNNRRLQDEQVRQQRTLLQHEVDILTQSLNQEVLSLNDNVRGMFNDRRMAVREEQKNADSAVQQINYKISTSLGSDSKSEIEGVRWVLIRRSALGIFFMAMLTLATVRYATYVSKERQREAAREKELAERVRRDGGKRDNSSAADAAIILAAN